MATNSAYGILLALLQTTLKVVETGDLQLIDDAQKQYYALYMQGVGHVADGRNAANEVRDTLASYPVESEQDRHLVEVFVKILDDNVPESFDVEERYLVAAFEFASSAGTLDDQELDSLLSQNALLEDERMRLMVERQNTIAAVQ